MINKKICALLLGTLCTSSLLPMSAHAETKKTNDNIAITETAKATENKDKDTKDVNTEVVNKTTEKEDKTETVKATENKDEAINKVNTESIKVDENKTTIKEDKKVSNENEDEDIAKIAEKNKESRTEITTKSNSKYMLATESHISGSTLYMTIHYPENGGSIKLSCSIYTELANGDSGNAVMMLQAGLNSVMSSHLEVDGKFGDNTESALKKFQKRYIGRNEDDGITGPKTWRKLNQKI